MAADAHAAIGKTHRICQDHAAAGATPDGGLAYAVVSDGCSSSADSEFGSWALVRATEVQLREEGGIDGIDAILRRAERMAAACWVDRNALDATLLAAVARGAGAEVWVWGDGAVLARRRDGGLEVHHLEYRHGAPAYPAYRLDPARLAIWLAETERGRHTVAVHAWTNGAWETRTTEEAGAPGEALRLSFAAAEYDLVGVASDGLASFQRRCPERGGLTPVPLLEVVADVLAFKGAMAGEFVVRRMRRLQKDMQGRGWQHDDDLSIAMLRLPWPEAVP